MPPATSPRYWYSQVSSPASGFSIPVPSAWLQNAAAASRSSTLQSMMNPARRLLWGMGVLSADHGSALLGRGQVVEQRLEEARGLAASGGAVVEGQRARDRKR